MQGKRKILLGLVAIALALSIDGSSYGAVGDFTYGSTVTPSPINPTGGTGPGSQVSQAGVGNFTTPTAPVYSATVNPLGTDIVVGTINITDLGIGPYTDIYGPTPISISLKIKDAASGATGTFTFAGDLAGQVASNGTSDGATFINPFTSAAQMQTLGGQVYAVRIDPTTDFAAPGAPPVGGTGLSGTYTFNVSSIPVPEPTTIGLLALAGCGIVRRRRSA